MPLTDAKAKSAKGKDKTYKLSDEKGLYLLIQKTGAKHWKHKYRFDGKEKSLSYGPYPEVSLKEARENRDDARKLLRAGIDPGAAKKTAKQKREKTVEGRFKKVALDWYANKKNGWAEGHSSRVLKILENDLFPSLGAQPISEISAPDILSALRKIEAREAFETAKKARIITGQVFRYGIATELCSHDITAGLKDALTTQVVKHFAAITNPKEAGRLLLNIDAYDGTATVRAALKISALLAQRPGEIRHMEWAEINWDEKRWEIPSEKMKMRENHIVPLASQTLEILKEQQLLTGKGRYVFPSPRGGSRPLSENGVRVALRNMNYTNEEMSSHGFRAMFRTILDEVLEERIDLIEAQLAHAVKDANGRAYNRTKYLPQRAEMMQRWADYLDTLRAQARSGNVITAKFGEN